MRGRGKEIDWEGNDRSEEKRKGRGEEIRGGLGKE